MRSPVSCRPPQHATGKCPYTVLIVTRGQLPERVIGMYAERIQLLIVPGAATHTGSHNNFGFGIPWPWSRKDKSFNPLIDNAGFSHCDGVETGQANKSVEKWDCLLSPCLCSLG